MHTPTDDKLAPYTQMLNGRVQSLARRSGLKPTWASMMARCTKPTHEAFANYGGRGVRVCERWLIFENFVADMWPRPSPKHSMDRIDNARGYEPGNVRWATRTEQARNTRLTMWVVWNGERVCVADLADAHGLTPSHLGTRLRRGWPVERALGLDVAPLPAPTARDLTPLTSRQAMTLEIIKASFQQSGRAPLLKEIAAALSIPTGNGVTGHVRALERKGFVVRTPYGVGVRKSVRLTTLAIQQEAS